MKKTNNVSKFKISNKFIMLGLIIVAVVIIVTAMYVTEFTKNNVSAKDAFKETIQETWVEVNEDDFLKHFEKFEIKETKLINPIFNGKEVVTNGKASISVETTFDNELDKKERYLNENTQITITVQYGADWVGYVGSNQTFTNLEIGSKLTTRTISDFNQLFPTNKLLFVRVNNPELFVLVKWTDNSTNYYTLLTLNHNEYR